MSLASSILVLARFT